MIVEHSSPKEKYFREKKQRMMRRRGCFLVCSQIVIGTVPHNCSGMSRNEKRQRKKKWASSTQVTFIELLAVIQ